MRMEIPSILALALLTLSATASAAEHTGRYFTHSISQTKTTLPNGNTSTLEHFYILGSSDDANDPQNNTAGNCTGNSIASTQGKVLSFTGICFREDSEGNTFSYWWKMDEAGTARCPGSCGSYRILGGTGKFKGLTGSGTFVHDRDFSDGGSGTSKGTYQMP